MAGFKAEGVVDALEYDFRPYVNAHGITPEPTDRQISQFLKDIQEIVKSARKDVPQDIPGDDPVAVLKALDDMDPDAVVAVMGTMCEAYSALCTGTPSGQEIADLPLRVRQIFFNWLQSEVLFPEAGTGGGNVRELSPRPARAG